MKITKHLYRRLDILYDSWLHCKNVDAFGCKLNNVLSLHLKLRSLRWQGEVFGFDKIFHEQLAKSFIRILLDSHLILKSWSKLLWFFLKLIDGNLPHKHREVFNRGFILVGIVAHCNVSLV